MITSRSRFCADAGGPWTRNEVQYPRRSRGRFARPRRGGPLTWMDAKIGGLGGHAKARKNGRVPNTWSYNALALLSQWLRQMDSANTGAGLRGTCETRAHFIQQTLLVRRRRDLLRCRRLQRATGNGRLVAPTRFSPSRSIILFSMKRAGILLSILCRKKLLTPVVFVQLEEGPEYKPIYAGDVRSRDGSYHQGDPGIGASARMPVSRSTKRSRACQRGRSFYAA